MTAGIHGYTFGEVVRSPVSRNDLDKLLQTVGWTEDDRAALALAAARLDGKEEALVDGWRSIIGSQPHLSQVFTHPDGSPNEEYKAAVKKRFVQWVSDILTKPFDQDWLDYQEEIGRRHTPDRKNVTDGGDTPPVVPMRYLIAFLPAILESVPRHMEESGAFPADVDAVARAWARAVVLTITLWTRPYVEDGLW